MKAYERLIKYSAYPTASDENSLNCPSTPSQLVFAKALKEEMEQLGLENVELDENGYLFGTIASNIEKDVPVVGFIAHMDVVDDVPFENIKTHLVENYDGGDIVINKEKNIVLLVEQFPFMEKYKGKTLLFSDGTTLIGADDKAGVAEIMCMAEYFHNHPEEKHGKIMIGFTPDEEIGRGADKFDVKRFGADFAYTCDGAAFGEVCYENFNAASLKIKVNGRNIHPGESKGKMKNSMLIAMEYNSLLPINERPEYTEKYEGFYHITEISGDVEHTTMSYILRDHDAQLLEQKKEMAQKAAEFINAKYGEGTVETIITDSYKNMAEKIKGHENIVDLAFKAIKKAGGEPFSEPIRGGTDGSTLSYMGLICPNLGTGSHNHHGSTEFAVVEDMQMCVTSIIEIAKCICE